MINYQIINLKTFFILIVLIGLSACNNNESTLQTIRFGLAAAPVSLDPRFATDATSARINRLLYQALVDFDEQLRPVPDLATWQVITPTHYRFQLKADRAPFHNGLPLTAHDVKATYDFVLAEKNGSLHRGSLSVIQQIQVVDENTVDFILQRADTLFPGRLMVGIVPQTLIETGHPFNKKPVGNGMFQFVKWPQSSQLYLKRLRDGQLFEFTEVKDPVVRVLKLVRGEIDLLQNDLSPELVAWLAKQPQIKVDKGQSSNFSYLGFNLQEPVTRQLVVRQAIAYALDRQEIIHYVLGNAARPATSFVLPPTHWAGNADLPAYTYNPTQARTLLAEIGITPDNPLTLTYKTSNNPFRVRIATVIQHQLAKVGINVDLRTYDWGTFYGDIKSGRFQLYSLSWVGIKMPDIFHYAFHSSMMPPNGANRGRLNHPTIDKLIEQAESATTLAEQAKYYRQLQVLLNQELPYVALWYEDHVFASQQAIERYTLAADGNYDGLKTVEREALAKLEKNNF